MQVAGDLTDDKPAAVLAVAQAGDQERREREHAGRRGVGPGDPHPLVDGTGRHRADQPRERVRHRVQRQGAGDQGAVYTLPHHTASRGHFGGPDDAGDRGGDAEVPGAGRAGPGQDRDAAGGQAGHDLAGEQHMFAIEGFADDSGEGAKQEHGHGAGGGDEGDVEAGAGDVEGEQCGRQKLEPSHRVDAAADGPQAQERRGGQ